MITFRRWRRVRCTWHDSRCPEERCERRQKRPTFAWQQLEGRDMQARSNASMQSGAAQGCFRDASLKESRAADSLLLSVTKSVQKRCMATLFTSRKGHPAPRSRYSCSTCRAQRVLEKIGRRCGGQGASFSREDARCAPEAAALIGNLIAPDRSSPELTASEHGESQNLRSG